MIIYYMIILLFLFIFYVFKDATLEKQQFLNYKISSNKNRDRGIFICAMLLFLTMALKPITVGTDTIAYLEEYNKMMTLSIKSFKVSLSSEIGFKIIMFILAKLGISFRIFLVIYSAFITITLAKFIKQYCLNYFLGFYLYITIGLFAMNMTGIRQSIAICFVLFSFDYARKKKIFLYILCFIIAVLIHYTALICFVIGLIATFKYKNKWQLFLGLLAPVTIRVLTPIIYNFLLYISPKKYFYSGYFNMLELKLNLLTELYFIGILLVCYICLLQGAKKIHNRDYQFFILTSAYVCCYELSYTLYMLVRLSFYFNPFMIVLLVNVLYRLKKKRMRIMAQIFLILFSFLYFIISIPGSSFGIDKYICF